MISPLFLNIASIDFSHIVYLLSLEVMICYWLTFIFIKIKFISNFCKLGITIANVLIFLLLALRWAISGYFPLSNLYESLLFLNWCLLFAIIFLERKIYTNIFGAILAPINTFVISFTCLVLPTPMQKTMALVPALQSNWLMMHVSMMIISYSILLLGSLLSIFYIITKTNFNQVSLYQKLNNIIFPGNVIKIEKLKIYFLEILDIWSYRMITFGFPFLTLGIIAGAVWANEAWGNYWSWDPKETWALITWFIFAAYIHLRLTNQENKEKSAVMGSIGFCTIWVCYLGVNFLGQGLHSYGWLN